VLGIEPDFLAVQPEAGRYIDRIITYFKINYNICLNLTHTCAFCSSFALASFVAWLIHTTVCFPAGIEGCYITPLEQGISISARIC
jgi:hypothetical protein